MADPVLLWLRQDLRLRDQPALLAAADAGPVVPVYVLDDEGPGDWRIGGAQRWWLHHSLARLDAALRDKGSRLILRRGPAAEVLARLREETGAAAIHATRHYEPWWAAAEEPLAAAGPLTLHDSNHLVPPEQLASGSGQPFRAYAAYWRALLAKLPPGRPAPAPDRIAAPDRWPAGDRLDDWALLPDAPDWSAGFGVWTPGEAGASDRLAAFAPKVAAYETDRNLPSIEGSSRLSPHLHLGEISPREVWHVIAEHDGAEKFVRELAWRDFTSNLLRVLPAYGDRNVRSRFDALPWRQGAAAHRDLRAWQRGRTGYPIIDAGMRQLWTEGWLPNRLRLLTASFLVKHLLIDWREGERWYWDCLVCADYGNNAVNWQWIAGSGQEASLWSRIMAPLTQSSKFDAADYIRRWVPELRDLPDDAVHDPEAAGARPDGYPARIVEHREARERALAAGRALG